MENPVILSAVRTPVGKFQGGLAGFSAPELGGKVVAEAARRAGIETKQIDEAILGNVVQAGLGQNPARQAALNIEMLHWAQPRERPVLLARTTQWMSTSTSTAHPTWPRRSDSTTRSSFGPRRS